MALGEQTARSLGARPGLIRGGAALSFVLLAGAATAAAGPIAFVGLAAPHIVRAVVGPDQRLILPGAMVVGPAFLVAADTLGRWLVAPAELQTGIAAAILGGPIFVALVRSRRMAAV
jgi:iron complex transport system permease protein